MVLVNILSDKKLTIARRSIILFSFFASLCLLLKKEGMCIGKIVVDVDDCHKNMKIVSILYGSEYNKNNKNESNGIFDRTIL